MGILNTKLKCIHIHIPKTAGTSIRQVLGGGNHQTGADFYTLVTSNTDLKWEHLFKFAIVREPFSRFVSGAYHGRPKSTEVPRSSEDYLDRLLDELIRDEVDAPGAWKEHWLLTPQWHFTHSTAGPTSGGLGYCDYIGRFEELEESWKHICEKIGFDKPLPHVNKGNHLPIEEYKIRDREEKVKLVYKRDYTNFYKDLL
jgi:hypothetical protein